MEALSEYKIEGPFAHLYDGFVHYKLAMGYKMPSTKICTLRQIARGMEENRPEGDDSVLPREAVLAWIEPREGEKPGTRHNRLSMIRNLGVYLVDHGHDAYILPGNIAGRLHSDFVPRILTPDETVEVARIIDGLPFDKRYPLRVPELALLFRILCGCGLRISEALSLRVGDVDTEQGLLLVRNAKEEKNRIVPMHPSLTACAKRYLELLGGHGSAAPSSWLFPSQDARRPGTHLSRQTARPAIQRAFAAAGVLTTEGRPARVHDLRHSFVCASYDACAERGENPHALVPVLSTYLGHENIEVTLKYLHITNGSWRRMADSIGELDALMFEEVGDDD